MTTDIETTQLVLAKLGEYLGREFTEADLEQGYDSLGADSMDMVALAFEMERTLEIKILPEIFLQHDTIKGVMAAILASKSS